MTDLPAAERLDRRRARPWFASAPRRLLERLRGTRRWHEWAGRQAFFRDACQALAFNGIQGDYLEFGFGRGMTLSMAWAGLAADPARHFWAFDSFAGLPPSEGEADAHPRWIAGEMATNLATAQGIARFIGIAEHRIGFVKGFYADSLVAPATPRPRQVALVYIDCDLYSSTRDVLRFLTPHLQHGMILAFDDYWCWSAEAIAGERRALLEWLPHQAGWRITPFQRFSWAGQAFVLEREDAFPAELPRPMLAY